MDNSSNLNKQTAKNNEGSVHVSVLLDRSGSMRAIAADTIDGFNVFLSEQRDENGQCRVSLGSSMGRTHSTWSSTLFRSSK